MALSSWIAAATKNGTPIPPTPGPALQWHPSYRYFRVSQTTHDLHDAYRNGFLALESLLDHVTPQGKEGESKWFRRAMAAAEAQVHLAAELLPDATSPLADLCDELYGEGRTAVAHSKSSRKDLLPHDYASRSRLLESLHRLHRLHRFYLGLAAQVLGLRRDCLTLGELDRERDERLREHGGASTCARSRVR